MFCGVAAHSSSVFSRAVEFLFDSHFLVARGPRPEVWIMACLTLQQSELIRSDIASTRLLRDLVVSNVLIREDAFGKEDNQPGWALIVFQFSGTRWIGDVSRVNTFLEPQTTIYKWMFGETTIFYAMIWNHPIETSIYKWLFGVPGLYAKYF